MDIPHIPVLKNETIQTFKEIDEGFIIDCTLGYGGHSLAILESNQNVKLICNDQDDEALEFSKKRLENFKDRVIFEKGRFSSVIEKHKDKNITGILADIGVSSLHFDKKERGFSHQSPNLDMRMDSNAVLNAKEVLNRYTKDKLEDIFREYGEIKEYKKLASIICEARKKNEISTPSQLNELILSNFKNATKNFLSVVYQAIRIEVNDELGELGKLLSSMESLSLKNTVVAIICFHSLEDRIVKRTFKYWTKKCICPQEVMRCECGNNNARGKILTKKPILAQKGELKTNPRAKSSKMRVFQFN